MPDESAAGTSDATTTSSAAQGESGGNAPASGTPSADTTDWKSKYEQLQREHARVTGKAGSTQADLQSQLQAAQADLAAERLKAGALEKEVHTSKVLDEVLAKAPEKQRAAVRLAAKGLIPSIAETDPQKAAIAVLAQIEAAAPSLLKPELPTHPTVNGTGEARKGLAFTKDGKQLF